MSEKSVQHFRGTGSTDTDTPLGKAIKTKIQQDGPLPFRDFMDAVLYDPEYGFYTKGPTIGPQGEAFLTNAGFPAFGFAVARAIEHADQLAGQPLRIVEFGGGTGDLAINIQAYLSYPHDYVIVERSSGFRACQSARGLQTVASVEALSASPTFVFGNEVLDALPVHRVMGGEDGKLLELYVSVDASGAFYEIADAPSTPFLAERLQSEGVSLGRGQVAEICLELSGFLGGVASLLSPGYAVFVDYGDPAHRLYGYSRRNGTLRSFRSQQLVWDPFEAIGEQDLTADVDFSAVMTVGKGVGLCSAGFLSQGDWLNNLGIRLYRPQGEGQFSEDESIGLLTNPARLGSTFDVIMLKTPGLPDGPGLHPCG